MVLSSLIRTTLLLVVAIILVSAVVNSDVQESDGTIAVSSDIGFGSESSEMSDVQPLSTKSRRPIRPTLSTSDRILPIQLMDNVGIHVRAPKKKQLRPHTLTAILGKDFDPEWMTVDQPLVLVHEPNVTLATVEAPSSTIPKKLFTEVRALNLSKELGLSSTDQSLKLFENWLVKKAACSVRYVWNDIGPLFWPRWIKRGECVNGPSRVCSWPEGMHCVPAASITLHVLRWHCRPRIRRSSMWFSEGTAGGLGTAAAAAVVVGDRQPQQQQRRHDSKQYRCHWLKVPYPVTAECFCSC